MFVSVGREINWLRDDCLKIGNLANTVTSLWKSHKNDEPASFSELVQNFSFQNICAWVIMDDFYYWMALVVHFRTDLKYPLLFHYWTTNCSAKKSHSSLPPFLSGLGSIGLLEYRHIKTVGLDKIEYPLCVVFCLQKWPGPCISTDIDSKLIEITCSNSQFYPVLH